MKEVKNIVSNLTQTVTKSKASYTLSWSGLSARGIEQEPRQANSESIVGKNLRGCPYVSVSLRRFARTVESAEAWGAHRFISIHMSKRSQGRYSFNQRSTLCIPNGYRANAWKNWRQSWQSHEIYFKFLKQDETKRRLSVRSKQQVDLHRLQEVAFQIIYIFLTLRTSNGVNENTRRVHMCLRRCRHFRSHHQSSDQTPLMTHFLYKVVGTHGVDHPVTLKHLSSNLL